MRRSLFALLALFPLIASAGMTISAGMSAHTHADANTGGATLSGTTCSNCTLSGTTTLSGATLSGTTTVTGTVTSSKACASGYSRIGPNLCWSTNAVTGVTSLTRDTCTNLTLPDAAAKGVVIYAELLVKSANNTAMRFSAVAAYNDASCAGNVLDRLRVSQYEFDATAAGTILGEFNTSMIILSSSAPSLRFTDDTGDQGSAAYYIAGYFD